MIVEVFLVSHPLLISSRVSHQHLLRGMKHYISTAVKTIKHVHKCYMKRFIFSNILLLRPQTKAADEGSSTELEARFVAIPEAEVQWFHNKVELKEEKNRVTIIHQADMHMYCR